MKTNTTINLLAAAITTSIMISIMTPVMAQQQKYFSSPRRYRGRG